jgi:UDP-glucose 4-epimerase
MKILVTGASGFIGSALCRTLLNSGCQVRTAVRRTSQLQGLEQFVVDDVGAATDWSAALKGIDVIIHLAARTHIMDEKASEPLAEYRQVTVEGTRRLAREASAAGIKRIVLLSTVKVHGEFTVGRPFNEDDEPSPGDAYGISKLEAEQCLKEICGQAGVEHVIIRSPLVYGPGVKGNLLRLMRRIHRGRLLPLGGIDNRRSLISLDNLVDVLILSSMRAECAGQTFLVSDGNDISTTELVTLISNAMEIRARLISVPGGMLDFVSCFAPPLRRLMDRLVESLTVDSSKFRETLKWSPPQTLTDGIGAMVTHFLREDADGR